MPSPPLRLPPRLQGLRQSRLDVVGVASVEGGELVRYLLAAGFTKVVGHDRQPDLESLRRAHALAHAGLAREERSARLEALLQGLSGLHLGPSYLEGVEEAELILPTQAWFLSPANQPLQELQAQGRPFYSLIQAYLDLAPEAVVGVTGTHGKSTTTAMLAGMLQGSGRFQQVWLAGNDRHNRQALVELALAAGPSCLVLEVSNRQLLQMDRAPRVSCLTNISPNHLDEHGGLQGYVEAKRRIFELPGCEVAVRNGEDRMSLEGLGELPDGIRELRFAFSAPGLDQLDGAFVSDGRLCVREGLAEEARLEVRELSLPGRHNLANALAALAGALAVLGRGEDLARAAAALPRFRGLRHRIELVWQSAGVDYFDDLSSTTPQSTVAAVRALGRECVLICGGDDKGIGFEELAGLVGGSVAWVVLLPGAGGERLAAELRQQGRGESLRLVPDLAQAVELARSLARPGQAVLLSPACPGFFSSHYREGGFRQLLRSATSPRPRRPTG